MSFVANDFLGKRLRVGDKVVYLSTKSKDLKVGYIGALNEKTARVYNELRKDDGECRVGKDFYIVYYRNIVRMMSSNPISVRELAKYKEKPILIYQRYGSRWDSWWDIIHSISKEFILTAYRKELYFSEYGKTWFAFEYGATEEAVREILWEAFVGSLKEDDSDGE